MTHLMVNGLIRCGKPAGHISAGQWPGNTWITATEKHVTCEACKALGRQDAPQPDVFLQVAAELAKEALFSHVAPEATVEELPDSDPMAPVVKALRDGVMVKELYRLIEEVYSHKARRATGGRPS